MNTRRLPERGGSVSGPLQVPTTERKIDVLFCCGGRNVKQTREEGGGLWGGRGGVQMLQRGGGADNVLPRLPQGPDHSRASSCGSDPSWVCRPQLSLTCSRPAVDGLTLRKRQAGLLVTEASGGRRRGAVGGGAAAQTRKSPGCTVISMLRRFLLGFVGET